MEDPSAEAVLICGAYGTGKSSLAADMAEVLEAGGVPYAAIDLDWLAWANVEDGHGEGGERLMLANLAALIANFRAAGMTRFVLAGVLTGADERERLRETLGMPLRVARLTVPIEEIERRLAPDPTSGRAGDLEEARRQVATGVGVGLEDVAVDNHRPSAETASELVRWLGWV